MIQIPASHDQPARQPDDAQSTDVRHALAVAEEIADLVDELPDCIEAAEFGQSVAKKAAAIAANIERHGRVTDNQMVALENIRDGLERWFAD